MTDKEKIIVETMTFLRYGDPLERNQQWLLEQIDSPEIQKLAEKLSILSIQVLSSIAKNKHLNATDIATTLNVTRGGVSRIAKRLIQDNLIEEVRKEDNQKEINYCLTSQGYDIYKVHFKLLESIKKQHLEIIRSFNSEEQQVIVDYLKQVSKLSVE